MRRELHLIPPAPRRPRWPPVLWARWPLALVAFLTAVYGGAITLMFFYAWGGKANDDVRLDAASVQVIGEVVSITPRRMTLDGEPAARVAYRFPVEGELPLEGQSLAPRAAHTVGGPAEVQFLAAEPHVNRLVGARINLVHDYAAPLWRWVVLPGLAALVLWFGWVLGMRHVLAHGDVALAELDEVRELRYVIPRMLRVQYRFRDHRAVRRFGRHWVRARSVLGTKLLGHPSPTHAPVVHARRRPWQSRLASADDFVPQATPQARGPGADLPHWMDRT